MASLIDNINSIVSIFTDIKAAIQNKGVVIADKTPLSEYADLITSIQSGGGGATLNLQDKILTEDGVYTSDYPYYGLGTVTVTTEDQWLKRAETLEKMFYKKTNIDFTEFNIYDAYDIDYMFYACGDLREMKLTGTGISRAQYAFGNCPNLAKVTFDCEMNTIFIPSTSNITASQEYCFSGSSADVDCLSVHWTKKPYLYQLFKGCNAKKIALSTDYELADDEGVNMAVAFYNCQKLTDVDFGGIRPSQAKSLFYQNYALTEIPSGLDLSQCTTLEYAFYGCKALTEIPSDFSAPKCTNWYDAFCGCTALKKVGDIDLSLATNVEELFMSCTNVEEFPSYLNLSSVTNAQYMFSKLGSNNESLRKEITLDFSAKVGSSAVFEYAPFKAIHIASDTNFTGGYLFNYCYYLEEITGLNLSSKSSWSYDFRDCSALTTLELVGTISYSGLDLSPCPLLSHDSIMNVINALVTTTSSKKVTFGATNLAKLSDEEKAIATDKGWTLA